MTLIQYIPARRFCSIWKINLSRFNSRIVGCFGLAEGDSMKISNGELAIIFLAILVGILLIVAGSRLGWGLVWIMAGIFFIMIGITAVVLNLAWNLQGPIGEFLRLPVVNILILALVIISMLATVIVGIFFQGR
jgi:hypothetical protein